jgi:uncharacterized protein
MNTMTRSINPMTDLKPWYRHRWPWLLMFGPFVVVIAGFFTAWLAYSRQDALVVDDYYKQGKAINQDLRRDRAATGLQLHADMQYDAASGRLVGTLTSAGKPYVGKILFRLVHSTQPEKDILMHVQTRSDGSFDAALPMLEIAHWQVLIENEQREWRLAGGWNWPQQRAAALKADAPPAE